MKRLFVAVSAGFFAVSPVQAQEISKADMPRTFEPYMQQELNNAIEQLAQRMVAIHPDGVISTRTVALHAQMIMTQRRAQLMEAFLRSDLNFDGFITEQEAKDISTFGVGNVRDRVVLQLLFAEGDDDGDGALSYEEIRTDIVDKTENEQSRARGGVQPADFLFFDLDGNDEVTIVEMSKAMRALRGNQ